MTRYIALLRAVNVGGKNRVGMADLRALIESLGFTDVRTLLQSGNVVFRGAPRAAAKLESELEKKIGARFDASLDVHVRTAGEWAALVTRNPFTGEARNDPGRLVVTCFREPLAAANVQALRAAIAGPETLIADGRHLYMVFPRGMGNSKAAALVERKLGARGTARNWNTVLKLAGLASDASPSDSE